MNIWQRFSKRSESARGVAPDTGVSQIVLKDFIKQTLVDIILGIREAQTVEGAGAFIVPAGVGNEGAFLQERGIYHGQHGLLTTVAEFDIAVTAETHSNQTGKASLSVRVVEAGVQGQTGSKNVAANRIQFSVPLKLPVSQDVWSQEEKKPLKRDEE